MPRFVLLEHTGAPDDPAGRHYDLLLEAGAACRTWRLAQVPDQDGGVVAAVELAPHRLVWLDHHSGEVSGGRGFARRTEGGEYDLLAGDASELEAATTLVLAVRGDRMTGRLRLTAVDGGWVIVWTAG